MNGPFISPKPPVELEIAGVVFLLKPLTTEQKMPLLFQANREEGGRIKFGAEAFRIAVHQGLAGWRGNGAPEWSANMQENVDLLNESTYLAIGRQVLDMSFVTDEAKKNS